MMAKSAEEHPAAHVHGERMKPAATRSSERGIALVMVMIFTVLLYVLVAELVVTSRMHRLTGQNEALVARMRNHMAYTLAEIEEQLKDDLAGAAAEEEGPGLGDLSGPGFAPGAAEEGEEQEADPAANADSSQDAWYAPTAYADDDLTTYVWVEDENRKFNILTLVSPDEEFAEESRHRFIRLVDYMRDGSEYDLSPIDGESMANAIIEWLRGGSRTDLLPRPPLKSDGDEIAWNDVTIPLHLDELMLVRGIDEKVFYDMVLDERLIPGLESVLTIYTSLATDPGRPDQQGAAPAPEGSDPGSELDPADPGASTPDTPIGEGIKININTAPPAVLKCLFPEHMIPHVVIDAILRYRNEEAEEEGDAESGLVSGADYYGDLDLGEEKKRKIFASVQDLEELPEFQNLANLEAKEAFYELTTVKSDVFSVHMASLFKRSEEHRIFVLRRSKSVLVRLDDGEEGTLHPLILLEDRAGMRVQGVDFPDESDYLDYQAGLNEMDEFSQEERRWNPFYLEFYRPKHLR